MNNIKSKEPNDSNELSLGEALHEIAINTENSSRLPLQKLIKENAVRWVRDEFTISDAAREVGCSYRSMQRALKTARCR